MELRQYQVDAFAEHVFTGNPAAVVLLPDWLPDRVLQAIAAENNLSETAFLVAEGKDYQLRWFTPLAEVDLCGHATLASAHILFVHECVQQQQIKFHTRSGELLVSRVGEQLEMSLPAQLPSLCVPPPSLVSALGLPPEVVLAAEDYLAVYPSEAIVRAIKPDLAMLSALDRRGVIITAVGHEADFVSRFFAPKLGIDEDPVTGSAHCQLAPYWGARLQLKEMRAYQCSRRGGWISCRLAGEKVFLTGKAVTVLEGTLRLPDACSITT